MSKSVLDLPLAVIRRSRYGARGKHDETGDFTAFVIFIISCLEVLWFSPERYRKPFMLASTMVPATVFVLLIWQSTGLGLRFGRHGQHRSVATHMFSQKDYTRYARKPGDQVLAQLIMVPLGTIVVACIGIICTSCAYTIYSEFQNLLWSPYIFFEAVRNMVVASNAVVAGTDLAATFPRRFTLRRGGYFTILFAFIMQPWSLLNGATSFLTVVGSFNVFLGPLWFSDETPKSLYWYTKSLNWRAAIAWPMGFWFLLPGLAQRATDPDAFWTGWTRLYDLSWFLGAIVAGLTYLGLDFGRWSTSLL
ncbi:hypothetical protein B0A50_07237 [Salinomyces thailandicus]|uniref:Uncharacterized protein n=1 Tax=Salinomyces thailandicus TaxID=706561 RepID=A0A4V5N3I5_9PEZI|nr:hypothetical protein B0A50_07237 [Salinomyces thailandica]